MKYKGVVEIDVLGESRGFKFGMAAMAQLCQLEKCDLNEVQERLGKGNLTTNLNLYYSAAVQFARLNKKPEPSFEEVCNWIDHLNEDQNKEAVSAAFATYDDPNLAAPEKGQSGE